MSSQHRIRWGVFPLFFLSGATGLVYEILWTRLLTIHVFGTTAYSVSTVLAAFMTGLCLGAYGVGRRADHWTRPLCIYGWMEIGIGIYAFLFLFLLQGIVGLFLGVSRDRDPNTALILFRFVLAFGVLLVPAMLMGSTLPLLSRSVATSTAQMGKNLGILYGLNTFGAVLGTILTGFWLIKTFGVTATLWTTGVVNLLIGLAAVAMGQKPIEVSSEVSSTEEPSEAVEERIVQASVWAFGISGFCALGYEVLWTHLLVLFLGSTTYAFTTMLAAFLFGIAFGSAFFARFVDRFRRPARVLAWVQGGIGIFSVILFPVYTELYTIVRAIGFGGRPMVFFVCVLLMLLPTTLMGASFPLVAKMAGRHLPRLARTIGGVYASNTFGAILGSIAGGFVILPLFGMRDGVLLLALLNVGIGGWVLWSSRELARPGGLFAFVLGVTVVGCAFLWIPKTQLITKSAIYQEQFARFGQKAEILFYRESVEGSVTVLVDPDGAKRLYVDTNEAANDTRWDAPSHRVIAHVPLLLHPHPKRALVVGFGMGRTSHSIVQHGVEVDAVEIHPDVLQAARRYFSDANGGVLDSPLLHLHVNDGRNFILTTRHRYDMISTGIIHPLVSSGSSAIYSRDFYRLCRNLLTEEGVMSQWVPLHRLPPEDFKTIIRTFLDVFPETTIWYKYTPDFLILIGTKSPQRIDIREWIRRTQSPKVRADLAADDLDTWSLLDSYFIGADAARKMVGEGPLHTDDKPVLEFFGSNLGGVMETQVANLKTMQPFRESPWSLLRGFRDENERQEIKRLLDAYFETTQELIRGQILYASQNYEAAVEVFQKAYARNPQDAVLGYHLQEAARLVRRELDVQIASAEKQLLEQIRQDPQNVTALTHLGLVYRNAGRLEEATFMLERAQRLQPENVELALLLGEVYEKKGDLNRAIDAYEKASRLAPGQVVIYGSLAALYEQVGRVDDAIRAAKEVLRLEPGLSLAHSTLGGLYLSKGDYAAAAQAYQQALATRPHPDVAKVAWNGLGIAQAHLGKTQEATLAFRNALRLDPHFEEARQNLAQLEQK